MVPRTMVQRLAGELFPGRSWTRPTEVTDNPFRARYSRKEMEESRSRAKSSESHHHEVHPVVEAGCPKYRTGGTAGDWDFLGPAVGHQEPPRRLETIPWVVTTSPKATRGPEGGETHQGEVIGGAGEDSPPGSARRQEHHPPGWRRLPPRMGEWREGWSSAGPPRACFVASYRRWWYHRRGGVPGMFRR